MADLYKVLGTTPDADATIIKRRYRELALELHPDRNGGDPKKTERFQQVSIAYSILGDEKKRAEYDLRRKHPPAASPGSIFGPQFNDLVEKVAAEGVTGDNWRELFSDLFGAATEFQENIPNVTNRAKSAYERHMRGSDKGKSPFATGGVLDTLEELFGTKESKK